MPIELPIINLSSFLCPGSSSNEPKRRETALALHNAILTFGFFYITGLDSLFSPEDFRDIISNGRSFFEQPTGDKVAVGFDGARGYQKLNQNVTGGKADHHEGLDIYCPVENGDPTKLLFGPNRLPTSPAAFVPTTYAWVDKCKEVGMALMVATAMGLGIEISDDNPEWQYLKSSVDKSFWVMRYIGYPELPLGAAGVSCGAHKDYGCWTILHADETTGALQVFLKDPQGDVVERGLRGRYINADPLPNSFVVNIGEMFETWTNGLYQATLHRVIHTQANYRVSIPFFYEPAFDAVISPLPSALKLQLEMGQDGANERKPDIVYGSFLQAKVGANFAVGGDKY